jgi:membrane glycosyltransferase
MHALTRIANSLSGKLRPVSAYVADLPEDSPMHMPPQPLRIAPRARAPAKPTQAGWRLGGLMLATVALTVAALTPIFRLLSADSLGPIDVLILVLVGLLFAWTAFSFFSALAGFFAADAPVKGIPALDPSAPLPEIASRTAVLMPIYNEAPAPVFARVRAMCESIDAIGAGRSFDLFLLSDSTDPATRATEYGLFQRLRARMGARTRVFYRHRPKNVARKAGNIADWVRRFGGAYAHMVVLDADSLMEGATLVRLAGAMEALPDVGLIQTAPTIVNRHTLFARAEQFASRMYGPMLAHGVAWWSGSEGNYWGHNAIIRIEAFARHAGLPQLAGPRPFGGHILSHDFVEAALLRRAGWRVLLAAQLGGSYEESPPTLAGLLARDRRWCQGNLQHIQVLWARGLHWISRFHLLRGISAYLVAPLWLALLASAVALPLHPSWGVESGAARPASFAANGFDMSAVALVFALSAGFLLAPKALAYVRILRTPEERRRFGGARRAALGIAAETVLSTLAAPLIMISHTRSIAAVLAGRDSGWAAQARETKGVCLAQSLRLHALDTLLGWGLLGAATACAKSVMLWMAPEIVSLGLAVPLAMAFASPRVGHAARGLGMLLTPEENWPPQILVRASVHR